MPPSPITPCLCFSYNREMRACGSPREGRGHYHFWQSSRVNPKALLHIHRGWLCADLRLLLILSRCMPACQAGRHTDRHHGGGRAGPTLQPIRFLRGERERERGWYEKDCINIQSKASAIISGSDGEDWFLLLCHYRIYVFTRHHSLI